MTCHWFLFLCFTPSHPHWYYSAWRMELHVSQTNSAWVWGILSMLGFLLFVAFFFWQFISICQIYCLPWLLSLRFLIEKLTLHVRYLVFCYAWCLTAKHPSISRLVLVWFLICNWKNSILKCINFPYDFLFQLYENIFLLVYCSIYVWKMVFWFVALFAFVISRKKTQLSDITG